MTDSLMLGESDRYSWQNQKTPGKGCDKIRIAEKAEELCLVGGVRTENALFVG
jgi:hypothetical protein